jgi:putative membrane protein
MQRSERIPVNPDSVVRDHLANERTFLAWVRTAIGVMALGLAVAKFVNAGGGRANVAGVILVLDGVIMLGWAYVRSRRLSRELRSGSVTIDDDRAMLVMTALVAAGLIAGLLLLI